MYKTVKKYYKSYSKYFKNDIDTYIIIKRNKDSNPCNPKSHEN